MPFKTPGADSIYIRSVLPPERDEKVKQILQFADAEMIPVLLPETAAFLRQTVMLKDPKKILEIGTAIGYGSSIILSSCNGHLFTVEIDERLLGIAKNFFEASGFAQRVTTYLGDANEIVPLISGSFDMIFLDGPKTRYVQYLPYLKRVLGKGGVLFCDNVLFNGMVSGENELIKKKTTIVEALDKFIRDVASDERFITSVLPVGDGVLLAIKRD